MSFPALLATGDKAVRQTLGGPVTYSPGAGSPVTVQGVFDSVYVKTDSRAGVSTTGPAVFLTLADLPSNPTVDLAFRVTVGTTVYKSRGTEPDGLGGVLIHLLEV